MANNERNYYVLCDDNCRFPSMTYEQILEAIAEATGNTPSRVEDAFITKVKESNHNGMITFWKGTEAEFNALSPEVTASKLICRFDTNGKMYVITDDEYVPVDVDLTPYRTADEQDVIDTALETSLTAKIEAEISEVEEYIDETFRKAEEQDAIDDEKVDKNHFNSPAAWSPWTIKSGTSVKWAAGGYRVSDGMCFVYMSFTTTEAMSSSNTQRQLNANAFPAPLHATAALVCQALNSPAANATAQVDTSGIVTMYYGGSNVPANVQCIISGFYPVASV